MAYRYEIQPRDVLRLDFANEAELTRDVLVAPDGTLNLPMVGMVKASDKTVDELEAHLTSLYASKLREPDIAVSLLEAQQQYVYVGGEVKNTGIIPFNPQLTVQQAIVAAGGAQTEASLRKAFVVRDVGETSPQLLVFDYWIESQQVVHEYYLRPKDLVIVPKSDIAEANQVVSQYINELIPFSKFLNASYNFGQPNL